MEITKKKQIVDVMGDDAYDILSREIAFLCPTTYNPFLEEIIDLYPMKRSDNVDVQCGLAFIKAITIVDGFMYNVKDNGRPYCGSFVGLRANVVKRDMSHVEVVLPICSNKGFNHCMKQMERYIINVKGDRTEVLSELHQVVEALANTLPSVYVAI